MAIKDLLDYIPGQLGQTARLAETVHSGLSGEEPDSSTADEPTIIDAAMIGAFEKVSEKLAGAVEAKKDRTVEQWCSDEFEAAWDPAVGVFAQKYMDSYRVEEAWKYLSENYDSPVPGQTGILQEVKTFQRIIEDATKDGTAAAGTSGVRTLEDVTAILGSSAVNAGGDARGTI